MSVLIYDKYSLIVHNRKRARRSSQTNILFVWKNSTRRSIANSLWFIKILPDPYLIERHEFSRRQKNKFRYLKFSDPFFKKLLSFEVMQIYGVTTWPDPIGEQIIAMYCHMNHSQFMSSVKHLIGKDIDFGISRRLRYEDIISYNNHATNSRYGRLQNLLFFSLRVHFY